MRSELLALPAFALLAACEKAVTVVSPVTYPDKPVTEITVQFSEHFNPGTFRATLDGNDITALFAPAPAPKGQSTAQLPGLECGFTGGQTAPVFPPPGNRAVYIDSRPQDHSPSSGAVPAQPVPVSTNPTSSPVPPPPNGLTVFWHRIVVDGDCSGGRICEGDERQFLPLHLAGLPIPLPLAVGTRQNLEVVSWPPATVPIDVKILPQTGGWPQTGGSHNVRLNGGALGAATSVTVPPGGRAPPTVVEGTVRPSQYTILLCSPGTQRGVLRGPIN